MLLVVKQLHPVSSRCCKCVRWKKRSDQIWSFEGRAPDRQSCVSPAAVIINSSATHCVVTGHQQLAGRVPPSLALL